MLLLHFAAVDEALAHPYLASLHDPTDEPTCAEPFVFQHDAEKLPADVIRDLVLQEIGVYHPQLC